MWKCIILNLLCDLENLHWKSIICRPLVGCHGVLPRVSGRQTSFTGHLAIDDVRRQIQRDMVRLICWSFVVPYLDRVSYCWTWSIYSSTWRLNTWAVTKLLAKDYFDHFGFKFMKLKSLLQFGDFIYINHECNKNTYRCTIF